MLNLSMSDSLRTIIIVLVIVLGDEQIKTAFVGQKSPYSSRFHTSRLDRPKTLSTRGRPSLARLVMVAKISGLKFRKFFPCLKERLFPCGRKPWNLIGRQMNLA